MGLGSQLRNLSKEYLNDPKGQYFRHLKKMLNLHGQSGVSKEEVRQFVKDWLEG